MSDHDEVERGPADETLGLSRRTLLRLGLLTAGGNMYNVCTDCHRQYLTQ